MLINNNHQQLIGMAIKTKLKSGVRSIIGTKVFKVPTPLILALVAGSFSVVALAAKETAETVELSNGQSVHIGQSIKSLKDSLGDNLISASDEFYQYTANQQTAEVVILADHAKVTTVMVLKNAQNHLRSNQYGLDASVGSIKPKSPHQSRALDKRLAAKRLSGVTLQLSNATASYLTDPCSSSDRVKLVALVQKGHEDQLNRRLGEPDCSEDRN